MPTVGRLRSPRLSSPPASPAQGEMYFDTGANKLYWWSGTAWIDASGGSAPPEVFTGPGTPPGSQVLWIDTDEVPPTSAGMPAGGATGQVLSKTSATDYATQWTTPASPGWNYVWTTNLAYTCNVGDVVFCNEVSANNSQTITLPTSPPDGSMVKIANVRTNKGQLISAGGGNKLNLYVNDVSVQQTMRIGAGQSVILRYQSGGPGQWVTIDWMNPDYAVWITNTGQYVAANSFVMYGGGAPAGGTIYVNSGYNGGRLRVQSQASGINFTLSAATSEYFTDYVGGVSNAGTFAIPALGRAEFQYIASNKGSLYGTWYLTYRSF